MKHCSRTVLSLVLLLYGLLPAMSQTLAHEAVQKDYPHLFEMYGIQSLEKQKAHYIFAIDVSSFMKNNITVINPMIKQFIQALPDGDQVTLIRKSSTDKTDYVQNIKSVPINAEVRSTLARALDGPDFAVQDAGSDGYSMTSKILDAIMNPMSEGLVFVFMFTDFEYWTAQNSYDKSKEDWNALKEKFQPFLDLTNGDQSRVVFPYAFYFRDNEYRENADYRPELKDIFGSLNQPPAGEAAILRSFFASMEANALAYRLKYMVFQDLAKVHMNPEMTLTDDGDILLNVSSDVPANFNLYKEYSYQVKQEPSCLDKAYLQNNDPTHPLDAPVAFYSQNPDYNPILPRFVHVDGSIEYEVTPLCDSLYTNELNMLNGLDNSLVLDYDKSFQFEQNLPKDSKGKDGRYFFHILPGWLDILIVAILTLWLLSLLATFLMNKLGNIYRTWILQATVDDGTTPESFSHSFPKASKVVVTPASLGITNGDTWKFNIITVDGPIYRFWKPRGYYIDRGTITSMQIIQKKKSKAVPKKPYRMAPLKKWGMGCELVFTNKGIQYNIRVK